MQNKNLLKNSHWLDWIFVRAVFLVGYYSSRSTARRAVKTSKPFLLNNMWFNVTRHMASNGCREGVKWFTLLRIGTNGGSCEHKDKTSGSTEGGDFLTIWTSFSRTMLHGVNYSVRRVVKISEYETNSVTIIGAADTRDVTTLFHSNCEPHIPLLHAGD
jgi:hypothetical protein